MSSSPRPKYVEIARAVELLLLAGPPGAVKVPSSREVAANHKVSVVTASRALQVLRDEGTIRTVERSGSYVIRPEAAGAGERQRWALVVRSTPGPFLQASRTFMHGGFAATESERGDRFETDRFDLASSRRPSELLRQARRAAEEGVRGVFFMPSRHSAEAAQLDESFLRACREVGLPVVLIERNLRGVSRPLEYDLVAADDVDGGLRCTRHLLEGGRRRVAFVAGSPTSSHEGRMAGYLAALQQSGGGWHPLVLEQRAATPTKAAYEDLTDAVLESGVDGVVCYQDYTALGLIMGLLTRGVRVPRDVAVTGFDDLPIGKAFALGLTTFAFSTAVIARQARRLMEGRTLDPDGPPIKVLVPGDLVVRESSGPAVDLPAPGPATRAGSTKPPRPADSSVPNRPRPWDTPMSHADDAIEPGGPGR